ncbi:MAG: CHRD domain-containing protein [Pseudolabrys sp.]|nr:CHRD domain-containing protein [Pseudolabrys sp.]MDP2294060.1 CHRD domain-containing protein [Pseudolabrys sp.]
MTPTFLRSAFAAVTCFTALALAGPAFAEMVNLKAALNGAAEVPPNPTTATGTVTATYDTVTKKLSWKGSYTGLSGVPSAAHFHTGEAGKNGGVAVPIFAGATAKSPFEGEATLTDAQAADLLAGKLYANIHTEANKAGEIRGQLVK